MESGKWKIFKIIFNFQLSISNLENQIKKLMKGLRNG